MFCHSAPLLLAGLASFSISAVDARMNLLRIAHWENQRQTFSEKEETNRQQPVPNSLSSIASSHAIAAAAAAAAAAASTHSNEFGLDEGEADDEPYEPYHPFEIDEDIHFSRRLMETQQELDQHLDSQRADRELLDMEYAVPCSISFSFPMSFSFSLSMSFEYTPTDAPIFDEFPDLTADLSLSYPIIDTVGSYADSTGGDLLGSVGATSGETDNIGSSGSSVSKKGPSIVDIPAPSPSPVLIGAPGAARPSHSPITTPAPTATLPGAAAAQSSPSNIQGGGGEGKNSGSAPANSPVASPTLGSSSGDEGGKVVTDASEEHMEPVPATSSDVAQATLVAVLVGAVVAVASAVFLRMWYQRTHGAAQSAAPVSSSGSEISSQVSSSEGEFLNNGAELA